MFKKESKYLRFNKAEWYYHLFDDHSHLISLKNHLPIGKIHECVQIIEKLLGKELIDIIPAYDSIAIIATLDSSELIEKLEQTQQIGSLGFNKSKVLSIPICYELGTDIGRIAAQNNSTEADVIAIHLSGMYQSAMIGFQPGFVYADGLSKHLYCPRKNTPERQVMAGSVGIGGSHTGIYSFDSPGGWNIIGRIPIRLFDKSKVPPVSILPGEYFQFERITKEAFEEWKA